MSAHFSYSVTILSNSTALPNVTCKLMIFSHLLFYDDLIVNFLLENDRKLKSKFDCVGFLLLNSRKVMEHSGTQDSKEFLKPPSGQAKGEKSGQRLSHSFRLGELSLEHVHAAYDAVSESF